jgi:hypothetical protein
MPARFVMEGGLASLYGMCCVYMWGMDDGWFGSVFIE